MMTGYRMGDGWLGMGLWWILLVGLVAVVVLAVAFGVLALRRMSAGGPPAARTSAREILDQRYARGEVGRDEYEQKKRDLAG